MESNAARSETSNSNGEEQNKGEKKTNHDIVEADEIGRASVAEVGTENEKRSHSAHSTGSVDSYDDYEDDEEEEHESLVFEKLKKEHMDWTAKQGRILTANGKATEYFSGDFKFEPIDLPHHYLQLSDTFLQFERFRIESQHYPEVVSGAFTRTVFYGAFEYSSENYEVSYNLQAKGMFIDLRVPKSRERAINGWADCLTDYNAEELRLYARQHVFAGYTVTNWSPAMPEYFKPIYPGGVPPYDALCTRHHAIDWNYVGNGRSRPNKWWVETSPDKSVWKEWAYARDPSKQHYYCEHWRRLSHEGDENQPNTVSDESYTVLRGYGTLNKTEGIMIFCGDHFSYCLDSRRNRGCDYSDLSDGGTLIEVVDAAIARGDLATARRWLGGIEAGHARRSKRFMIDCAIEPWKEGYYAFKNDKVEFEKNGESVMETKIFWRDLWWGVFETTETSFESLVALFTPAKGGSSSKKQKSDAS